MPRDSMGAFGQDTFEPSPLLSLDLIGPIAGMQERERARQAQLTNLLARMRDVSKTLTIPDFNNLLELPAFIGTLSAPTLPDFTAPTSRLFQLIRDVELPRDPQDRDLPADLVRDLVFARLRNPRLRESAIRALMERVRWKPDDYRDTHAQEQRKYWSKQGLGGFSKEEIRRRIPVRTAKQALADRVSRGEGTYVDLKMTALVVACYDLYTQRHSEHTYRPGSRGDKQRIIPAQSNHSDFWEWLQIAVRKDAAAWLLDDHAESYDELALLTLSTSGLWTPMDPGKNKSHIEGLNDPLRELLDKEAAQDEPRRSQRAMLDRINDRDHQLASLVAAGLSRADAARVTGQEPNAARVAMHRMRRLG